MIQTNDGRMGGSLDGDFHSAPSGGISAVIVTDNNAPVLLEKNEVIINRKSVEDPTKRTLTGSNKQILSQINESGGGVPILAKGGEVEKKLYGGKIGMDEYLQINDSDYRFSITNSQLYNLYKKGEPVKLSETISHNNLFGLYPNMGNVLITFKNSDENGGEIHGLERLFVNKNLSEINIILYLNFNYYEQHGTEFKSLESNEPDLAKESILLHEIQHILQALHNRPAGTTIVAGGREADAAMASLETAKSSGRLTEKESQLYPYYSYLNKAGLLGLYFYYSDESEIQARKSVRIWLKSKGITYIDPLKEYFGMENFESGGQIQPEEKNKYSGYNYINPDELKRAKNVDLLTLPALISGTNCSNCFPAGNTVFTKNGSTKIEDIRVGDEIFGYKDGEIILNKVLATGSRKAKREELIKIGFGKRGSVEKHKNCIVTTLEHPFFVCKRKDGEEYVKAEDLKIGDEIFFLDRKQTNSLYLRHSNPRHMDGVSERTSGTFAKNRKLGLHKKHILTEAGRASVSHKMKINNPSFKRECIEKMQKTIKDRNPNHYQELGRASFISRSKGMELPSSIEKMVIGIINKYDLPIWYCGDAKYWIGNANPDFKIHDQKKVIETWCRFYDRDDKWAENRKARIEKSGYECLMLEIAGKKVSEEFILKELQTFISNGAEIKEISKINKYYHYDDETDVYNIQTETENYFIRGRGRCKYLLVHNCSFFSNNFCTNEKIKLPVNYRQCCALWDNSDALRSWETNSPNKTNMENTNSDEILKGGRADGKAIWDIAIKFNVPIDYAMEQLDKGLEEEKEHTPDFKTRYEIALDHLYDDIEYYNKLKNVEGMAKGGEIKVTEGNYPSGAELWRVSQKNTNDVGIFPKKFYPTKESAISAYKIKLERQNDLPEEIYIEKDTSLLPYVIAQVPAEKFAVAKLESKYGRLTQAHNEEYIKELRDFGNYLVARAEFHYQNQPQFKKHVRASGNKGRDYLIMFMNHWAAIGSDNKSNWKSAERSKKEWLEAYNKGVIAEEPDYLLNFDEYISKHGISKSKEALAKKTYLQSVKEAAEKNLYQQEILQGEISAIKAQNILEEAGLHVPEEIREATAEEVEEIAEELDEIKEKRMKEAQEFENFKKQAIIAEPMTRETTKAEVLESLEALKVSYDLSSGKEKELIGEAIEAMQVMYDSMPDVLCCGGYVLKQDGETITETYN